MTTVDAQASDTQARAVQRATRIAFLIAGIGMASWAPLVPYAKQRAQLSDGSLGTLLLCLGLGSLIAMPLTGVLVGRFGCKRVMATGSALLLVLLPLLASLSTPLSLGLTLMVFGAAIGLIDVAMNIQAVEVEKAADKAMMSGFHGFFSAGGDCRCRSGQRGPRPWRQSVSWRAVYRFITGPAVAGLPASPDEPAPAPAGYTAVCDAAWLGTVPRSDVLYSVFNRRRNPRLGGLFLNQARDLPAAQAGLGYAVFSVAMTIGRLTGDRIVNYFGRTATLFCGTLCAAAGMLLAVLVPSTLVTLLGFMLIGFGGANAVPIMFTAAGKQQVMPVNLAISAMTTIGYAGILAGPALVGFISQLSSLSVAFSAIAALLLVVAASARLITR